MTRRLRVMIVTIARRRGDLAEDVEVRAATVAEAVLRLRAEGYSGRILGIREPVR